MRLPGRFVERARVDVVLEDVFDFISEERRRGGVVAQSQYSIIVQGNGWVPGLEGNIHLLFPENGGTGC